MYAESGTVKIEFEGASMMFQSRSRIEPRVPVDMTENDVGKAVGLVGLIVGAIVG
jgi:hypothetical protein